MPLHALLGHAVVVTAPLTGLLALVYAWRPDARRGLRLPLALVGVLNLALAIWAETAGTALLKTLQAAAATSGQTLPGSVLEHKDQGEALTVAALVLMAAVLGVAWRTLAPGRPRSASTLVGSILLTTSVAAVWWFSPSALVEGLQAVWAQHTPY